MGIKYNKRRPLDEARERFVVYGHEAEEPELPIRGRLLIVYMGIAAFVMLAFLLGGRGFAVLGGGTRDGAGTVTAKSIERLAAAELVYVIELRADAAPEDAEPERFRTTAAAWEQIEPGQRVRVIYDVDRAGGYQRARHVGLLEESAAAP